MMQTLAADNPRLVPAHPVITRAANAGGEGIDSVDEVAFAGALLRGRLRCIGPPTASPIRAGITVHTIDHNAVLSQTVQRLRAALYPAPAQQVTQG